MTTSYRYSFIHIVRKPGCLRLLVGGMQALPRGGGGVIRLGFRRNCLLSCSLCSQLAVSYPEQRVQCTTKL